MAVPQDSGQFTFTYSGQDRPTEAAAACFQKVNKILCVVVYENGAFTRDINLYNHDCRTVKIISSDLIGGENKTVYYLNNDSPTLNDIVQNVDQTSYIFEETPSYTWRVVPQSGKSELIEQTEIDYEQLLNNYTIQKTIYYALAPVDQENYVNNNQNNHNAIFDYEKYLNDSIVQGNQYINFPISSIRGNSKIICAIKDGQTYLGTGFYYVI